MASYNTAIVNSRAVLYTPLLCHYINTSCLIGKLSEPLTMPEPSLEEQIKQLNQIVQNQSKIIAETGKRLLDIEVRDVKSRMANLDTKQPSFDVEDFASNEDIAQLVFEVLNQLDYLEDRNIKRAYNCHISDASPDDTQIAPLCSKDGESAPNIFPATVKELNELRPLQLIQLCEFYDLFVDQLSAEDEKLLHSPDITPEQALKLANVSQAMSAEDRLVMSSKEDLIEIFDEFTRYIGVRIRRGSGW